MGALFHLTKPYAAIVEDQKHSKWTRRVATPLAGQFRSPEQSADTTVGGLTVNAFVAFVAKTASNPWIEPMVNPDVRVSGGVALAWFEYDVHRGTAFSHCGVNAVTLRENDRRLANRDDGVHERTAGFLYQLAHRARWSNVSPPIEANR